MQAAFERKSALYSNQAAERKDTATTIYHLPRGLLLGFRQNINNTACLGQSYGEILNLLLTKQREEASGFDREGEDKSGSLLNERDGDRTTSLTPKGVLGLKRVKHH